jgi:hypothetical protein
VKWIHEDEARIVLPPETEVKFIEAGIKKIMIGANFDKRYFRPLLELCRLKGYPVEVVTFTTAGEFNAYPLKKLDLWG